MKNVQAEEFYNALNNMSTEPGSHRELAQAKTLRNMKEWFTRFVEKINDIKDTNCATKEVDGVKILMKDTLKRTVKNTKGEDVTDEYKVNVYTPEGQKKMTEEIKKYMETEAVKFDIYSTDDDKGVAAYLKEVLTENGFLLSKEEQSEKVKKLKNK